MPLTLKELQIHSAQFVFSIKLLHDFVLQKLCSYLLLLFCIMHIRSLVLRVFLVA